MFGPRWPAHWFALGNCGGFGLDLRKIIGRGRWPERFPGWGWVDRGTRRRCRRDQALEASGWIVIRFEALPGFVEEQIA